MVDQFTPSSRGNRDPRPDRRGRAQAAKNSKPRGWEPIEGRHAGRSRFPRRAAFAAIDLGTNNCRLLIAKPSPDGFVVIDAFSRIVRLGEGIARTGRISGAAMDRAVGALGVCAEKIRRRHVSLARSVATEACRRASNGEAFLERVRRETGLALEIISAEEEAQLAVLGCHVLLEPGEGPSLVFDIGGGSTELVLVETGGDLPHILDWESAPWGVVSLTESENFDARDPGQRLAAYANMRARAAASFEAFARRLPRPFDSEGRLLGTSGTVTTLASLHLELAAYDRSLVDGLVVPSAAMREISAQLATAAPEERAQMPCVGTERADLVVAGCAILEAILDIWPTQHLRVADRGIREGILRRMIADHERARGVAARGRPRGTG